MSETSLIASFFNGIWHNSEKTCLKILKSLVFHYKFDKDCVSVGVRIVISMKALQQTFIFRTNLPIQQLYRKPLIVHYNDVTVACNSVTALLKASIVISKTLLITRFMTDSGTNSVMDEKNVYICQPRRIAIWFQSVSSEATTRANHVSLALHFAFSARTY